MKDTALGGCVCIGRGRLGGSDRFCWPIAAGGSAYFSQLKFMLYIEMKLTAVLGVHFTESIFV